MKKALILIAFIAIATIKLASAQSKTNEAFNAVLSAYYDVKNALATDKADLATEKVKVFTAKIDAVQYKNVPDKQDQFLIDQAKVMKKYAVELAETKDIKAQRHCFEGISNALIKTLSTIKFNSKTAYVQYCPMAKSSWLNEKQAIENPYYGKMMFSCGKVTETINAK